MVTREEILHSCSRVLVPEVRSQLMLDVNIQLFQCHSIFAILAPVFQKRADLLVDKLIVRPRVADESSGDIGLEERDIYAEL